jgi:hypothetical protein
VSGELTPLVSILIRSGTVIVDTGDRVEIYRVSGVVVDKKDNRIYLYNHDMRLVHVVKLPSNAEIHFIDR